MSEWQPIETAPKDDSLILLWTEGFSKPIIGFRNGKGWSFWDGTVMWSEQMQDDYAPLNSWVEGYGPTHWMLLPEPPK